MILRNTSCLLLTILFVLLFTGCRQHKASGKKIFRYNETTGIASLDPAFAKNQSIMWAVHQLYSTLVEVDANAAIQPLLAKNWEFSADKKTIIFNLRTDIFFHDDPVFPDGKGRRMVAEDVRYSLNRFIDAATASPGA